MDLLRPATFALVVALACLNRETGLFLVVMHAAFTWQNRAARRWSLVYLVIGIAVVGLVRLLVGPGERFWTLERIITANLFSLPETIIVLGATLGALGVFAWRGARSVESRPFLVTLGIYVVPIAAFGLWREVRLLLPVFPAILWLAACGLSKATPK